MNSDYQKLFLTAGLSVEQAKIYDTLLKNKGLAASKVSRLCSIERSLTYKVLNQLIDLKLAQKHETTGQITRFVAEHPQRILEIVNENRSRVESSYQQIQTEIGDVISSYNLTIGKPGVRFMEGIDGLKKLHEDIIRGGTDIKLFRSHIDKMAPESLELIRKQIDTRLMRGLKTKVIGPLPSGKNTTDIAALKKEDASRLVDRRVIDDFEIPTQIMIYGNKVAITDYKNILTTLIDNESVRETFEKIFDHVFSSARKL